MKAVIINHSDIRGGASVVSRRLLDALCACGVDASMIVVHKSDNDERIREAAAPWRSRVPFLAEHLRIFTANGFNRDDLFKVSIATNGLPLSRHPLVEEADAVILNWVNQGMLSLGEIERLGKGRRLLWTMHDMWNMTGICHHAGTCTHYADAGGCRGCPLLHARAGFNDLSHRTWLRKKHLYEHSDIRFVAVSSWLCDKALQSTLLRRQNVRVIPNAFPVEDFAQARPDSSLPVQGKIIMMGAARLDDPVKGLDYAIESLNRLAHLEAPPATAVFFGAMRNPAIFNRLKYPHIWLGTVEQSRVASLYARADIVMSTSLYETLPGTLIEGQAAGATPVSFDRGGQRDIIASPELGRLVPFGDTEAFADALAHALRNPCDPAALRQSVEKQFSARAVARAYIKTIEE